MTGNGHNLLTKWLSWRGWLWLVGILGCILVLLQIGFRPLDRDEGFYLYGAWKVFQGAVPYRDFFYPQAPYLPYLYAPVVGLFRDGILAGRVLSAVFNIGLAWLCGVWVHKRTGNQQLGVIATGLLLFGNLVLYWHSAVKTYAASDFIFFLGFVLLMVAFRGSWRSRVFLHSLLSGVLVALAFHMRLVLVGAVPYLLLLALLAPGWGRGKRFWGLVFGMVVASIPAALLFFNDPQRYWFNNLTFHITARLPNSGWQFAVQKFTAFGEYLGNLDVLVLVILCVVGIYGLRNRSGLSKEFQREVWMGLGLAGMLFATYLTAPPLLPQYLVQLSPFLVLGAVAGIATVLQESKGSAGPVVVLILLLIYGGWGIGKATGRVLVRKDMEPLAGMAVVQEVGNKIQSITSKNEQVFTWWPGYLVAAKRDPIPGTGFGRPSFRLEWRKSADDIRDVGLFTQADFEAMIKDEIPSVVVAGFDTPPESVPVIEEHYRLEQEIGGVRIFTRP